MATLFTSRPATPARPRSPRQQSHLQECLHEPWAKARDTILDALEQSPYTFDQRAYRRMEQCGAAARFWIDPDQGKVRAWIPRCKHRLCPFCAQARGAHVAHQITDVVTQMVHPRQIILTVASTGRPLAEQLPELAQYLRRLRRSALFRHNVTGGIYVVEITLNDDTELWHPHIHIVYDGKYIPHARLKAEWHRITQHSKVVWISDVKDKAGMAWELAKYLAKPQRIATWPVRYILEYAHATRAARMVQTFGRFHGAKVQDRTPGLANSPDSYSVSLNRIVFLATRGDEAAQRLALAIAVRWPLFASFIYHELPQCEPAASQAANTVRMLAAVEGRPPPRHQNPQRDKTDEQIDAEIFLHFNRFRLDDERGTHTLIDEQERQRQWPSTLALG